MSGDVPTKISGEQPTRVRWLVLVLACSTSWLLYVHRYAWGVVKSDLKQEFQFTDTQLGWLDSAFSATYALFQVPCGHLGDTFGPAIALPAMILGWSCLVGATGVGGGFWGLASIRVLFGVTQAGAYPNLGKVTKSWFPLSVRTSVQGAVASLSGRAGGACASVVVGTLLIGALGMSWRTAFVVLAGIGIVFAVIFRFLYRDSAAQHPWANEAEQRLVSDEDQIPLPRAKTAIDRHPAVLVSFSFFLVQQFTSAFADILFVYWLALFLEEAKGLDKLQMGIFASLPLWGGAIGGMVGGVLNDVLQRRCSRRVARSAVGLTGKLLSAILVGASTFVEDGRTAMVVLAAAKFFTDWSQPTVWGTLTDIGGRAAGKVFGTVNMIGNFGAFAASPILGAVKQYHGWSALFWSVAGVLAVSGLSWPMVDCTKRLVVTRESEP